MTVVQAILWVFTNRLARSAHIIASHSPGQTPDSRLIVLNPMHNHHHDDHHGDHGDGHAHTCRYEHDGKFYFGISGMASPASPAFTNVPRKLVNGSISWWTLARSNEAMYSARFSSGMIVHG